MDLLHLIVLAIIQGLTEFLPVSSSAHLILFPIVFGWEDPGMVFDVAVHVGTLLALVLYFRKQLQLMITDWFKSFKTKTNTINSKLAWYLILATIPAGIAGLLSKDVAATFLRSPIVIAIATITFALLLWFADARGRKQKTEHNMKIGDVLLMGTAQALALIPGTSRSGITITGGLFAGLSRQAAARFSFIMAIPVIFLAGIVGLREFMTSNVPVNGQQLIISIGVSFISSYLTMHFFIKLLNHIGLMPFVWYRIILGITLLAVFL